MLRFILTEPDAKRYGVEAFDYDPTNPRLKEIRELGRQCGLTWNQLQDRLPSGPKDKRPYDLEAGGIIMWLAAIRSGVNVTWDDFDIDLYGTGVEQVDDPNPPAPTGA